MNFIDIKQFRKIGDSLFKFRYATIATIVVGLFGFTVWRIDSVSSVERDNLAYQEQLLTVQKVSFDEEVIDEILRLRDTGIEVEPKFPGNRTNPFE